MLPFISWNTRNKNADLGTQVKIVCMQISWLRKSYMKPEVTLMTKMLNPHLETEIILKKPRTMEIWVLVGLHPKSCNHRLKYSSCTSLMCLKTLAYSLPVCLVSCHLLFAFFFLFFLFSRPCHLTADWKRASQILQLVLKYANGRRQKIRKQAK